MNLVSSTMKYDKQSFKTKINLLSTSIRKSNNRCNCISKTENDLKSNFTKNMNQRILTPTNVMFSTNTKTNSNNFTKSSQSPDFLTTKENCFKTEDGVNNYIQTYSQGVQDDLRNLNLMNDNNCEQIENLNTSPSIPKNYYEFEIKKHWKLLIKPLIDFFMSNNFKIKMNHDSCYKLSKSNLQFKMFIKFTKNKEYDKICFEKDKGKLSEFDNAISRAEYEILLNDNDFQINLKK